MAPFSTARPTPQSRDLTFTVAVAQGSYYVVTGVWPLLHMRSFLKVTGPKADLWLVETVGGLVGAIGGALLAAGLRRRVTPELKLLGIGSAAALAAVEGFHALRGRIPPVYLADAVAEVALCAAWVAVKPPVGESSAPPLAAR